MKRKLLAIAVLAMCGAVAITAVASAGGAGGRIVTKVTIKAEGTDLFGYVKSDDEQLCAADRKVKVFRVKRGDKEKIGTDNAQANGNRYQWSLGNTGLYGRFYAKVARTPDCGGDESRTIRVARP